MNTHPGARALGHSSSPLFPEEKDNAMGLKSSGTIIPLSYFSQHISLV